MSAPDEYFKELREELGRATSPEECDVLLDEWFDAKYRATDYDAVRWGLDPKRWMSEARKEMEARISKERSKSPRSPTRSSTRGQRAQG